MDKPTNLIPICMTGTPRSILRRQIREEQRAAMERFQAMTDDLCYHEELFDEKRDAEPERLIELVSQYFNIPVNELTTRRGYMLHGRVRRGTDAYDVSYIQARAIAYYLLYHYTNLSYLEIGKYFLTNGEPMKSPGITIALHKVIDWINGYDKELGKAALTLRRYCALFFNYTDMDKRSVRLKHEKHIESFI